MDFPKKQQQCLIPRYLLQYLTSLEYHHTDPTAEWGSEGVIYTAGDGITISDEDVISIDNTVALKTDIPSLTGYATETWVTNQGYLVQSDLADYITSTDLSAELLNYAELSDLSTVATTGDYNDLTNKPTIPDAVSGTNDGTNWTSLTIGNTTKNIPSGGSAPTNMVTTDTNQDITGVKTFIGDKKIAFKQSISSNVLGFTAYNQNGTEVGNLQIANRGTNGMYITLGNYSSQTTKAKVGFRLQPNNSSSSFNFVMPSGNQANFTSNTYSTSSDTTIPCAFTDGTTIVKADATGLVNISSISGGGGSAPSNMVTTDTAQNITGVKTIYNTSNGHSDMYFKAPLNDNSSNTMGFSAFDSSDRQIGGLQIMNRTLQFNSDESSTYYYGTFLTNFRNNSNALNTVTGFRVLPSDRTSGSYSINFVAPIGTSTDLNDIYKSNSDVNTVNLVAAVTDGTNTVLANKLGVVDISSLISGGGGGTTVSGTNDGTNWTSLTIGSDTYGIPSGGSSSGPTVTRYTGYTNYSPSISSATGYFYLYSSTLNDYLNIRNVKEGDYVEITIKYSWVNPNINMTVYEYETVKLYVPARNTQSGYDAILESKEKRIYDASNIETYIFHNPYTISQKIGSNIFISGTNKYDYIFRIYTCNRNYYNNTYGTMNATIVSLDHYSF